MLPRAPAPLLLAACALAHLTGDLFDVEVQPLPALHGARRNATLTTRVLDGMDRELQVCNGNGAPPHKAPP